MKRKKILHLISGLEVGGTEKQLLRILPKLQEYHTNAVCCVRGRGPIGVELEKEGVPVYYLNFNGFYDLSVIKRFYSVIKREYPDILVTYLIHADLYGRVFGRLFGIKKIISSKRGSLLQWEWLAFFDRLTKFMVTHYLVQTEIAQIEWMKKLKTSRNRFSIIPNGIETNKFQIEIDKTRKKKDLGLKEASFIISCVSRLRRGKGHEILLEAFENTFKENDNTTLLIVGDGEREKDLLQQIKNYSSKDAIHFLGNRDDIPEILAISDLFILPTEKEGMSNAIIEAMTAGVPIITTDIPENKDLLRNKTTGILFPINDVRALSDKIEMLIDNSVLRNHLKENSQKESAERFDVKAVTYKFAEFFGKL